MFVFSPQDVANGAEGSVIMTRADGTMINVGETVLFEANLEFNVEEFRILGNRFTQHKYNGANGTGTLNMYNGIAMSEISKIGERYLTDGYLEPVDFTVAHYDPTTRIGS